MNQITRSNLKILQGEIEETLTALGEKLGVKFTPGNAKFSPTSATFKLEVAIINPDGTAETKVRTDFKRYATVCGMKPEWLDQQITSQGKPYKILGLMPNSHKYPVLVECLRSGRNFKLMADSVIRGMEGK
jgi:hypothetical protein